MSQELDDIIHQKTRLSIMAHLAAVGESEFTDIIRVLGLTNGNLSAQSAVLADRGYIEIEKSFRGKKPLTVYRISAEGRRAFKHYLDELARVVRGGL